MSNHHSNNHYYNEEPMNDQQQYSTRRRGGGPAPPVYNKSKYKNNNNNGYSQPQKYNNNHSPHHNHGGGRGGSGGRGGGGGPPPIKQQHISHIQQYSAAKPHPIHPPQPQFNSNDHDSDSFNEQNNQYTNNDGNSSDDGQDEFVPDIPDILAESPINDSNQGVIFHSNATGSSTTNTTNASNASYSRGNNNGHNKHQSNTSYSQSNHHHDHTQSNTSNKYGNNNSHQHSQSNTQHSQSNTSNKYGNNNKYDDDPDQKQHGHSQSQSSNHGYYNNNNNSPHQHSQSQYQSQHQFQHQYQHNYSNSNVDRNKRGPPPISQDKLHNYRSKATSPHQHSHQSQPPHTKYNNHHSKQSNNSNHSNGNMNMQNNINDSHQPQPQTQPQHQPYKHRSKQSNHSNHFNTNQQQNVNGNVTIHRNNNSNHYNNNNRRPVNNNNHYNNNSHNNNNYNKYDENNDNGNGNNHNNPNNYNKQQQSNKYHNNNSNNDYNDQNHQNHQSNNQPLNQYESHNGLINGHPPHQNNNDKYNNRYDNDNNSKYKYNNTTDNGYNGGGAKPFKPSTNNDNNNLVGDRHRMSNASSGTDGTNQFATSFEVFDADILLDDDEDDNFAPVHYDHRFSVVKNDHVRSLRKHINEQKNKQALEDNNNNNNNNNSSPQHHGSGSGSETRTSTSTTKSHSNKKKTKQPLPPNEPVPTQIANKYANKKKKSRKNADSIQSNTKLTNSQSDSKSGAISIKITQHHSDTFTNIKPGTPSQSVSKSHGDDPSVTHDSDVDLEVLQRDRDYRPSIVTPQEHNSKELQVSIDRYGFPMDSSVDEKEHRRQLKKENARLLKWQDMVFPRKKGGTSSEADNAIDAQIHHWNSVKNHRKLKSRIRKGCPQQLRGTVWQNLCGARERCKIECARYGSKKLYSDLKLRKKSPYHEQIWKDINRTYRKNLLFGGTDLAKSNNGKNIKGKNGKTSKKGTQKYFKTVLQDTSVILTPQDLEKHATSAQINLYSVLKAFSLYRKDVGYCQGMQAVTALLLMYMTEEEAFWVLASLADDTKYQMENLWRPSMPAIQLRFYQMERLVKLTSPKLSSHFEKHGISSASMYQASQWFITIFLATNMKFNTIVRVWDVYLNEGLKTVFRMGVGLLKYYEKTLLKADFEQMLELFRKGTETLDTEEFIKVCFSFKLTHAQLSAFERDFNRQNQKKR